MELVVPPLFIPEIRSLPDLLQDFRHRANTLRWCSTNSAVFRVW